MDQQAKCPLFSRPAELRTYVYEYYICEVVNIILDPFIPITLKPDRLGRLENMIQEMEVQVSTNNGISSIINTSDSPCLILPLL
jgi:hypothetical protein